VLSPVQADGRLAGPKIRSQLHRAFHVHGAGHSARVENRQQKATMMNIFTHSPRSRTTLSEVAIVAGVLFACFSAPAFANDADAKLAIGRAQANLELIAKESPAGTSDQSFVRAQQKILDARTQLAAGRETEAVWFASEAELLADTALASARLISLEQEHRSTQTAIDTLQAEIRRN
jgi:hypothetical protein